jgi:hypothetical protein
MKNILTLVIGLTLTGSLANADAPDLSKLPPASKKEGLTYAKDIRPIFEASCFRCHGEERQKASLRLDSLEAVLKGSEDGKVILPGKSQESPLVIAIARLDEKKAMPPKPKQGGPGGQGNRRPGGPAGTGASQNPQPKSAGPNGAPAAAAPGAPKPGSSGAPRGGMGPMPKALTPEQVGLVRAWVDQGAK